MAFIASKHKGASHPRAECICGVCLCVCVCVLCVCERECVCSKDLKSYLSIIYGIYYCSKSFSFIGFVNSSLNWSDKS